ncbi:MAG: hypothetical protein DWQ31_19935 [Planctomycetota bacterium]|nr:MAG: hypothetical protein DWQ31_19935 [Planctomycetota bacterium]
MPKWASCSEASERASSASVLLRRGESFRMASLRVGSPTDTCWVPPCWTGRKTHRRQAGRSSAIARHHRLGRSVSSPGDSLDRWPRPPVIVVPRQRGDNICRTARFAEQRATSYPATPFPLPSSPRSRPRPMQPLDLSPLGVTSGELGVVVVDHGSRRAEANEMLLAVVDLLQRETGLAIVEPAHMELAEPTIAMAVDRCVARGARLIAVLPFFLAPGRHWDEDIPRLTEAAVTRHADVRYLVTAPLGAHTLMAQLMQTRLAQCLGRAGGSPKGSAIDCEFCDQTPKCRVLPETDAGDSAQPDA